MGQQEPQSSPAPIPEVVAAPREPTVSAIPQAEPRSSLNLRNSVPQAQHQGSHFVPEPELERALSSCIRSKVGSTKELSLLRDTSFSNAWSFSHRNDLIGEALYWDRLAFFPESCPKIRGRTKPCLQYTVAQLNQFCHLGVLVLRRHQPTTLSRSCNYLHIAAVKALAKHRLRGPNFKLAPCE